MAHSLSAKKRVRQNDRRRVINSMRRARVRTLVKKVGLAIQSGDKVVAESAFRLAQPEMHRASINGKRRVFSLQRMSRILSRLSARIKEMDGAC